MNVKAQGLINAAAWLEQMHGRDAVRDVLHACSAPVRERYVSAIAINWHPVEELIEFVEAAERIVGRSDGAVAEEIGAAGASANMKGVVLRIAFYLGKPDLLMRRVTGLWSQFNDEGEMRLLTFDSAHGIVEVVGVPKPNRLFCSILTGWTREVTTALGMKTTIARHTHCRAMKQARCLWRAEFLQTVAAADGASPPR